MKFRFVDYSRSETAERLGIDNSLPIDLVSNATKTFRVAEWLLDKLPGFRLTSGYRCKELNKAVGGAAHSDHLIALAFDFTCDDLKRAQDFVLKNTYPEGGVFSRALFYPRKKYIHVSINWDAVRHEKEDR